MTTHDPNHWKQEFDENVFKVPDWIAEKYPSASWHNDICPHFNLPKENHTLWVDAVKFEDRECSGTRFFIAYADDELDEHRLLHAIEGEEEKAEEVLKQYLAENYK